MKANDLRIGNWVFDIDSQSVKKIHGFFLENKDYDGLEPIELTEEWLKKFGFFSKYKNCNVRWNILGFDIQQKSDEDDDGNKIPKEQVFYFNYMYDIKYVHQLQNLYYALTEEELTIKQK